MLLPCMRKPCHDTKTGMLGCLWAGVALQQPASLVNQPVGLPPHFCKHPKPTPKKLKLRRVHARAHLSSTLWCWGCMCACNTCYPSQPERYTPSINFFADMQGGYRLLLFG